MFISTCTVQNNKAKVNYNFPLVPIQKIQFQTIVNCDFNSLGTLY